MKILILFICFFFYSFSFYFNIKKFILTTKYAERVSASEDLWLVVSGIVNLSYIFRNKSIASFGSFPDFERVIQKTKKEAKTDTGIKPKYSSIQEFSEHLNNSPFLLEHIFCVQNNDSPRNQFMRNLLPV